MTEPIKEDEKSSNPKEQPPNYFDQNKSWKDEINYVEWDKWSKRGNPAKIILYSVILIVGSSILNGLILHFFFHKPWDKAFDEFLNLIPHR